MQWMVHDMVVARDDQQNFYCFSRRHESYNVKPQRFYINYIIDQELVYTIKLGLRRIIKKDN